MIIILTIITYNYLSEDFSLLCIKIVIINFYFEFFFKIIIEILLN